ncbi:sigma-70 family RNA polymerase sigma factor [Gillisia sp. M10.2A]|uniref:Sigma-70 family RNA polymerase sigma factor n=1 Tax=Gillisia lutea TaxID=2909668 RepID=A0ABS9EG46_9FLAO|nr:sigma-70 family RNA polymerase sigma factor [Gillisia lutea]MCF4101773.1 sigma-70 family RNA polymerase sigma factor [Gillisia lutea]
MNQHTFINIINPVKDKVYRLALRLLVSKEAAEDATQEIILKLWNAKLSIKHYTNVEAFIMTMTKNYCLDQLKSKQNNNLKIVHSNYEGREKGIHEQLEIKDELSHIDVILQKLPAQQQLIFQLREVEQYEFDEIVEITGMNHTAIRVALSRIRKKLREEMIKKHRYGIT